MTIAEMRICRWCGFTFEGPSTRLSACPKCGQGNDRRTQFSISASNARPDGEHIVEVYQADMKTTCAQDACAPITEIE